MRRPPPPLPAPPTRPTRRRSSIGTWAQLRGRSTSGRMRPARSPPSSVAATRAVSMSPSTMAHHSCRGGAQGSLGLETMSRRQGTRRAVSRSPQHDGAPQPQGAGEVHRAEPLALGERGEVPGEQFRQNAAQEAHRSCGERQRCGRSTPLCIWHSWLPVGLKRYLAACKECTPRGPPGSTGDAGGRAWSHKCRGPAGRVGGGGVEPLEQRGLILAAHTTHVGPRGAAWERST